MAASFLKALPLAAALCAAAAQAAPPRTDTPVELDAAAFDFDYRNNVFVLPDVRITQGDTEVRANQATATATDEGPDIRNGEWLFTGDVRITAQNGVLNAQEALIDIVDGRIARAVIKGSPATFQQLAAGQADQSQELASGQAAIIEYDVDNATVSLKDNASLRYGGADIRHPTIVYNIRDEKILGNPGNQSTERVHITLDPSREAREDAPPQ